MKRMRQVLCLIVLSTALAACTQPPVSPSQSTPTGTAGSATDTIVGSATAACLYATSTTISAAEPSLSPTNVPEGMITLLFYPPLVLNYDPAVWIDKSEYSNQDQMVNYLQAKNLSHCALGPMGSSGFFPESGWIKSLGDTTYFVSEGTLAGQEDATIYYYLAICGVNGYGTENAIPVFDVNANQSDAVDCVDLAEQVLSTLHVP